ncbi:molybdenum ABC transporter ATP-binding protein [Algirhabdus cladophorae]|uniref:molybdenum ABC transporter ATP-binding protein n=1 Tax=Algirhabdus cladophorae TaxID=3377108 RepID=UPI003B84A0AE
MSLTCDIVHGYDDFRLTAQFQLGRGITAVFGPSGAGKTTLLNAISGTLQPDQGTISFQQSTLFDAASKTHLPLHKRRIGRVFQKAMLFPHLSVRQNLTYGGGSPEAVARITGVLGISHLLDRRPATLSGGEQQRVAIGRAVLAGSELLLMDEPLSSLDMARKAEILPYFRKIHLETQVPILYVSHDLEEIKQLADDLIILEAGQVLHHGPIFDSFQNAELVRLLGHSGAGSFVTARLMCHHPDGLSELQLSQTTILLPQVDAPLGTSIRLQINLSDVILSLEAPQMLSALNAMPVEVTNIHLGTGPGAIVTLRSGADVVLARITKRSLAAMGLVVGTKCYAVVKSMAIAPGRS